MCYSAQVNQLARKLQRQFDLKLDYDQAAALFMRRLEDPAINISRGFEANFMEPATAQGERIKAPIEEHRSRMVTKFEQERFSQKTRLVNAERLLKVKETKKAREDVRIATNKIEALTSKILDTRRDELKARDNRVFPMVYASVIIQQEGENILTPMRYGCRPAGKPAFYDKKFPGTYNSRRDNLEGFRSEQFGHHHAVMVADRFFENVQLHVKERRELGEGEKSQNVVLQFTPNPPQSLLIACLWSHWTGPNEPDVRGFAAITDEPPPDVALAGHDRCIINLQAEQRAWLTPEKRDIKDLQAILDDRAVSTYAYAYAYASLQAA